MKKIIKSLVCLFLITALSNTFVFAKSSSYWTHILATTPPIVTSPIYLCQNSPATPLTATPSGGGTLTWYSALTGGTALPGAPTPITTTVGTTSYYVTETILGVESSPRTPIVVNVVANTGASIVGFFCNVLAPLPDGTRSVLFDWGNDPLAPGATYNYTYTIVGGLSGSGSTTNAATNATISGVQPGQSVSLTITSLTQYPCVLPQTRTCSAPCVTTTTPNFPSIAPFCTGTAAPILGTTSPNGITGTWSPAVVSNTTSGSYVFTPDPIAFPCALTQTLPVTVDPLVTPAFTTIPTFVCQGSTAPILPTSSNNVTPITGTWSPATVNTAVLGTFSYTFTPNSGQCTSSTPTIVSIRIDSVVTPNFAPIPNLCSGSTAPILATTSPNGITGTWSPTTVSNTVSGNYVFTPTAGLCANTQSLSITILPKTVPNFPVIPAFCSGSTPPILTNTSPNGITGTWSPSTISNTTSGSYLFTPNVTECATTQTLSVTVNPNVTPIFAFVPAICTGAFLSPLPTTSTNGITGTWSPALDNTATTLYTFTPTVGQCATTTTLTINVNPIVPPNFAPIPNLCSGSTAPILATTSPNGITGTWSPAIINNTTNGSYIFTPTSGQCSTTQTLSVTIIPRVVTNFAAIPDFCSGAVAPILATTSPNGVTGTWTPATISNTTSGSYLFTPNANECATNQTLNVVVDPLITPDFEDLSICSGTIAPILETISPNGITGTWLPSIIDNTSSSSYVFTPDAPQCATSKTINVTVNPSNTLVNIAWTVTDAFSKNQIVTITASAAGNYLYQLDSGPFQASPIFENVASGIHSITVIEVNGCSAPLTDDSVLVIGYPKYFTPNGDTYNDTWNIPGLSEISSDSRIYIFDRYGKLLKDISPNDTGWDGMYIGQPMPASDYWFTVVYSENNSIKEFKSHFSLKR
jgi:gliding motility-associated-like protein